MRFQAVTLVNMNMTAVWDIVLCSLVEFERRFRDSLLPSSPGQRDPFRSIPEGSNLHVIIGLLKQTITPNLYFHNHGSSYDS